MTGNLLGNNWERPGRSIRTLEADRLALHRASSDRLYAAVTDGNLHDLVDRCRNGLAESFGTGPTMAPSSGTGGNAMSCGSHPAPRYRWHCALTQPQSELIVLEHLSRQGFVVALPMIRQERPRRVRGTSRSLAAAILQPMFPRYVFVGFDRLVDPWRKVWSSRGVTMLIGSSAQTPTPLPDGIVEAVIRRCGPTGILGDRTTPARRLDALAENTMVRVLDGAFTSFEGMVTKSSEDRVSMLLDLFGRQTAVTLSRNQVVQVD